MIKRIATVGGWTLISRVSGFIRDVVMAAVLGAGPMADAFFVAFRLPNHFRAIFRRRRASPRPSCPPMRARCSRPGIDAAKLFADRIAAALIAINLLLLALALLFTPWVVSILAPGFDQRPDPIRPRRGAHPHHLPISGARVARDRCSPACSTPIRDLPPRPALRCCSMSR